MNTKNLLLIGGLGLLAYALAKRLPVASSQAAEEPFVTEEVKTTEGTLQVEISNLTTAASQILAPGKFKVGTVGGLTGIWYNPGSGLDMSWLQGVSDVQRQPLRNITSMEYASSVAREFADLGGYVVKAF
jgi:hypothetical protein